MLLKEFQERTGLESCPEYWDNCPSQFILWPRKKMSRSSFLMAARFMPIFIILLN